MLGHMPAPRFLPLMAVLTLLSAADARSLAQDQAQLGRRFQAERRTDCEARVAPLARQLLLPELMKVRPDSTPLVRCWAFYFINHAQLRAQWAAELKRQGYLVEPWQDSGKGWHLLARVGNPRQPGYLAMSNSVYTEVTGQSALIMFLAVESQRLK